MLSVLLTIALLHGVALITPGANFILIGQLAASGKRVQACIAAIGVTTVTLTWASLAILGIGLVFSSHPQLRQICQVAGGLYLCYLAWKIWRAMPAPSANQRHAQEGEQEAELGNWAAFRLGFITNVLNPKTALFFGSVFSTALPHQPSNMLVLSAVLIVYFNALVWHLFLALAFSHPRIQAWYARFRRQFNQLAGSMMGAFGLHLLYSTLQELRAR